jgi:thymidylate synthase
LWFIHGDTSIKYLIDNECYIWNDDAFRYYREKYSRLSNPVNDKKIFIDKVKNNEFFYYSNGYLSEKYKFGDLDNIYGKQWRQFNGKTDQLQNCINTLLKNPDDRRMIVTAHNPTDIEDNIVGLPSCHNMFQFYTIPLSLKERVDYYFDVLKGEFFLTNDDNELIAYLDKSNVPKYYLNLWFNIRSNDFFLGQPYNMASYALLNHIISNVVNMIPNEIVCTAIDCHLYEAHIPAALEWLDRYDKIINCDSWCKSKIKINKDLTSIDDITAEDILLIDYNPQSHILAPLLT